MVFMAKLLPQGSPGEVRLSVEGIEKQDVFDWIAKQKEDQLYKVEIKLWRKDRNLNQNSLFHAIIDEISRDTGMDKTLVKEGIKEQYCPKVAVPIGEEIIYIPKPTHLLDTAEMAKVIDGAIMEAAFLGIEINTIDYLGGYDVRG